ncbi:hypothetical protein K9L97_04435 [Candidatus Woesearchaeota archaeon]|nr:hypothetical protein [Candidatus Woesearchaeota archaeon]
MMNIGRHLRVLNGKEIKDIRKFLFDQFGFDELLDLVFLRSNKDKVYVINREVEFVNIRDFWIDSAGLYFGKIQPDGFRLSVEGTQLIGNFCKKNVVEVSLEQKHAWLKGFEFEVDIKDDIFVLLKSGDDFLGCAKVKNEKVLNSLPKSRRLHVVNENLEEN